MDFLKSITSVAVNEAQEDQGNTGDLKHDHLTFEVVITKDHDFKHPMTLKLMFTPPAADALDVFATCPCSTAVCRGRNVWFNAHEPSISAALSFTFSGDNAQDTKADLDLALELDFANRKVENSRFEDERDTWDGKAQLHLTLTNLSEDLVHNITRRGFFKDADLNEINSSYIAETNSRYDGSVSAEECDGTGSKILLRIPVQYEPEEAESQKPAQESAANDTPDQD